MTFFPSAGILPRILPESFRKVVRRAFREILPRILPGLYRNPSGSFRNPSVILPKAFRNPSGILPRILPRRSFRADGPYKKSLLAPPWNMILPQILPRSFHGSFRGSFRRILPGIRCAFGYCFRIDPSRKSFNGKPSAILPQPKMTFWVIYDLNHCI